MLLRKRGIHRQRWLRRYQYSRQHSGHLLRRPVLPIVRFDCRRLEGVC